MGVTRISHFGRLWVSLATVALLLSGLSTESGATDNTKSTYDYLCCTSQLLSRVYHPGNDIVIRWQRTTMTSEPVGTLVITVSIIGPYKSKNALQHYEGRPTSKSDLTWSQAPRLDLSNSVPLNPVSVLHISKTARSGYYDLEMKWLWKESGDTGFGASVVRLVR
jgi:hypothetical protein